MADQSNELKAREYVFDLGNVAKENWFKPDESWELGLATTDEKTALEKRYYPTVSAKVLPEKLAGLLDLVKVKLIDLHMNFASVPLPVGTANDHFQYIVAFNPNRRR
ncbi:MAG: hypothetical protein ACXVIY_00330 [Mucilaginibacter sp.]